MTRGSRTCCEIGQHLAAHVRQQHAPRAKFVDIALYVAPRHVVPNLLAEAEALRDEEVGALGGRQ